MQNSVLYVAAVQSRNALFAMLALHWQRCAYGSNSTSHQHENLTL